MPAHAQKWMKEVDANLSGPMVCHNGKDYFVNEPALAKVGPYVQAVLPSQFFRHEGEIWARVQYLRNHPSEGTLIIDMQKGVCEEIRISQLFYNFVDFQTNHQHYGFADASKVTGTMPQ